MTVNLKKLTTLTLRMYKRFRCEQYCCSVVLVLLILKKPGFIRPAILKAGALLPGAIRDRRTARVPLLELRYGGRRFGRLPEC